MATLTKAQRVQRYRELYPEYHITAVKSMTQDQVDSYMRYGSSSLEDHYKNPSDIKRSTYQQILNTYNPRSLAVQGSAHSYSVLLVTSGGTTMHITQANNYLVEVQ